MDFFFLAFPFSYKIPFQVHSFVEIFSCPGSSWTGGAKLQPSFLFSPPFLCAHVCAFCNVSCPCCALKCGPSPWNWRSKCHQFFGVLSLLLASICPIHTSVLGMSCSWCRSSLEEPHPRGRGFSQPFTQPGPLIPLTIIALGPLRVAGDRFFAFGGANKWSTVGENGSAAQLKLEGKVFF